VNFVLGAFPFGFSKRNGLGRYLKLEREAACFQIGWYRVFSHVPIQMMDSGAAFYFALTSVISAEK
jgi:hypothetical protein